MILSSPGAGAFWRRLVLFISALSLCLQAEHLTCRNCLYEEDGIVRGDPSRRQMALIFTGGDYADGGTHIRAVLTKKKIMASFFFTGDFYRDQQQSGLICGLLEDGHYLGPHSDRHLLYCDWNDRGKTLVSREEFSSDLLANYKIMESYGIKKEKAPFFIPPYEWYNREIVRWSEDLGLTLFNFTPGTNSNADYTTPSMDEYLSSQTIYQRILNWEGTDPHGLNGFILLLHVGAHPDRTDKLYLKLESLVDDLLARGYAFVRIDELLR